MMNINNYLKYLDNQKIAIFLLHGVIKEKDNDVRNFNRKHILSSEFENLLSRLLDIGTAVSMDDILNFGNGNPMPNKPFAITFDDGFQNNLTVATPILRKYQVPATFYVTTDFIDRNLMSWIDRIDWAVEKTSITKIKLPWLTKEISFSSVESKVKLLKEIRNKVKYDRSIDTHRLADDIQKKLNLTLTYSNSSPIDKKLTWSELKFLSTLPGVTIGGHTHTHAVMSFLNERDLNNEISKSLELIKKNIGITSHHYSYPEGLKHCYNNKVISELKKQGILSCPTAEHGLNEINTNPFELKRIFVI